MKKSEWQPPNVNAIGRHPIVDSSNGRFECLYAFVDQVATKVLTPPRDSDTAYAVKEPCREVDACWYQPDTKYTADEMPDWAVRQHARITDIKLIISDGELWWDFGDLEKVAV